MHWIRWIALVAWALGPLSAIAAGSGGDGSSSSGLRTPAADPNWVDARRLVDAGDFARAIPLLLDVVREDAEHADAYNLLGFAHRKTGKLDAALKYYEKALAIAPKHRGAHEYIGEAYLEMGDLEMAKHHLAALDRACFFGCAEYDDLRAAIARYEARN